MGCDAGFSLPLMPRHRSKSHALASFITPHFADAATISLLPGVYIIVASNDLMAFARDSPCRWTQMILLLMIKELKSPRRLDFQAHDSHDRADDD